MDDATPADGRPDFRSRLRRRDRTESDTNRGLFGLKLVVFGLQLTLIGLLISGFLWLAPFGMLVSAGGLLVE